MKYNNLEYEKYNNHITKIIDTDVFMYLIEGENSACLIDSGHGVGDSIRELVETLTQKPVFVILTHNHEDHISGSGWFDEVYINEKDLDGYYALSSIKERFKRHQNERFKQYPIESYALKFKKPTILRDGQEFDLGGITLKVIECGGHTKGCMVVLIKEERIMIYGDAIGNRVTLFHQGLTVSEYLNNLKHVKQYDDRYDICLRSHNEMMVPLETINNLIECCEEILSGNDDKQLIKFGHVDGTYTTCYAAKKVVGKGQKRVDGKIGNIFYTINNAK